MRQIDRFISGGAGASSARFGDIMDPNNGVLTGWDISSKGSGQNWSMTSYCPVPGAGPQSPADNGYQPGFAAAPMLKAAAAEVTRLLQQ
mgnify:CR=1 FL=1